MSHLIDMTGQRFGKLTVIEKMPPKPKQRNALWRCRCDCGNERVVNRGSLIRGFCKSCGCLRSDEMELQYIKNDPDWKKKKSGKSIQCPYSEGVGCTKKECWRCGFNPKVAASRNAKLGVVK